ncbi:HXXEE domain-containing protein [Clostridium sp. 1001271B_151109_B4]|uniref:HXXEE domain-containing protein n=1 Tax=Clostridium sp. 1001271B_151109_B4 TaxID=2787148 RepID=UPI0018AB7586|nr:HXXEE domain-containing protein [Clostridium sp. 1001271B_151109_B4]
MNFYRNNWYKLTIVAFIFLSFFMGFWGVNILTPIQNILMFSFMALLVHQFEEYVLPGGGPVVINKANFGEKVNFRNFPGNMQSSMIVNNSAYIFYIAAIIWPQFIWLGLATMFFNLFQLLGHGIKMNRGMKTWYNPGLASVIFLFVPISIYYIMYVVNNNLVTGWDWLFGAIAFIIALIVTTILPVQLLKDINSPYSIPEYQVECCDRVQAFASLEIKKDK